MELLVRTPVVVLNSSRTDLNKAAHINLRAWTVVFGDSFCRDLSIVTV